MSKKDYIAIAAIIKKQSLLAPFVLLMASQLSQVFEKDNPLFNRDRFLIACGMLKESVRLRLK